MRNRSRWYHSMGCSKYSITLYKYLCNLTVTPQNTLNVNWAHFFAEACTQLCMVEWSEHQSGGTDTVKFDDFFEVCAIYIDNLKKMEFTQTTCGKRKLPHDGYAYIIDRQRDKVIHWRYRWKIRKEQSELELTVEQVMAGIPIRQVRHV